MKQAMGFEPPLFRMMIIDESVDKNSDGYFYVYQIEKDGTKIRRGKVSGWFYVQAIADSIESRGLDCLVDTKDLTD